jgi:hypothetical protein
MPGNYYKIERPIPVNTSDIVCADGLPQTNPPTRRSFLCILNKEYQILVEPGDILGLEIPPINDDDFDIWFTRGGPTNYIFNTQLNSTIDLLKNNGKVAQLPQVFFGFTSGKGNYHIMSLLLCCYHYPDQCTSGFPDAVINVVGINLGDPNEITTRLFPELKFGCSGKIVRFMVDVVHRNGQQSPKIQIWRPNDTQLQNIYYKTGQEVPIVDSIDVCLRSLRSNDGVFRCTLNDAYQVSVQPGDILGLELPSEIDDNFDIVFTEHGPENYMFEGSLTSPANLSEHSTVTNYMPQINFTVMLGKKKKLP